MRILDECLPRKLKNELPDHFVQTVPEAGWAGKQSGEHSAVQPRWATHAASCVAPLWFYTGSGVSSAVNDKE